MNIIPDMHLFFIFYTLKGLLFLADRPDNFWRIIQVFQTRSAVSQLTGHHSQSSNDHQRDIIGAAVAGQGAENAVLDLRHFPLAEILEEASQLLFRK